MRSIVLTAIVLLISPGTAKEAKNLLDLRVGIDSKSLYLMVQNVSRKPVMIYNQWKDYDNYVPGNIEVSLADANLRKVAVRYDQGQTVWKSWAKREDLIQMHPEFQKLQPGEQIRLQMPLMFLTERLREEYFEKAIYLQVGCTVYHSDDQFRSSVNVVSEWFTIPTSLRESKG